MDNKIYKATLDLVHDMYIRPLKMRENDNNYLELTILNDRLPANLSGVTQPTLAITRKDGVTIIIGGQVADNVATYRIGRNVLNVAGLNTAVAQFYDNKGRISTVDFTIEAVKDATGAGYIPTENEQTLIEYILNDVPELMDEMRTETANTKDATTKANTATGKANTAAANADAKAALANTATTAANAAATKANTAATNADAKAALANTATTAANAAATKANTAATNADAKAALANTAANNANTATTKANTAATNADAKANLANDAATAANAAATKANTAATNADAKAALANDAATAANNAATAANTAAANANNWQYKGVYAAATTYVKNNVVSYNGSSFMSLIDGNKGNTPNPTANTTQWSIIAQRGVDGTGSVTKVQGISPSVDGNVTLPIANDSTDGLLSKVMAEQIAKMATLGVQNLISRNGSIFGNPTGDKEIGSGAWLNERQFRIYKATSGNGKSLTVPNFDIATGDKVSAYIKANIEESLLFAIRLFDASGNVVTDAIVNNEKGNAITYNPPYNGYLFYTAGGELNNTVRTFDVFDAKTAVTANVSVGIYNNAVMTQDVVFTDTMVVKGTYMPSDWLPAPRDLLQFDDLEAHVNNKNNPHNVTSQQVNWLGNYSKKGTDKAGTYPIGVSVTFAKRADGWDFDFGNVLTVRANSTGGVDGAGGTLQIYTPYSQTFGGKYLKFRTWEYKATAWSAWEELETTANATKKITDAINALQIGGRNLITGDGVHRHRPNDTDKSFAVTLIKNEKESYYNLKPLGQYPLSTYFLLAGLFTESKLAKGQVYTASLKVRARKSVGITLVFRDGTAPFEPHNGYLTTKVEEWETIHVTFVPTKDYVIENESSLIYGLYTSGANPGEDIDIKSFKLEKGNKATDWTPAPEDLADKKTFDALKQTVDAHTANKDNPHNVTTEQVNVSKLAWSDTIKPSDIPVGSTVWYVQGSMAFINEGIITTERSGNDFKTIKMTYYPKAGIVSEGIKYRYAKSLTEWGDFILTPTVANLDDHAKNNVLHNAYVTCTTAGSVATKAVDLYNFVLSEGARITVKFTNANTANTPTIAITTANGVVSKPLRKSDGQAFKNIYANGVYTFVYNGVAFITQVEGEVIIKARDLRLNDLNEQRQVLSNESAGYVAGLTFSQPYMAKYRDYVTGASIIDISNTYLIGIGSGYKIMFDAISSTSTEHVIHVRLHTSDVLVRTFRIPFVIAPTTPTMQTHRAAFYRDKLYLMTIAGSVFSNATMNYAVYDHNGNKIATQNAMPQSSQMDFAHFSEDINNKPCIISMSNVGNGRVGKVFLAKLNDNTNLMEQIAGSGYGTTGFTYGMLDFIKALGSTYFN